MCELDPNYQTPQDVAASWQRTFDAICALPERAEKARTPRADEPTQAARVLSEHLITRARTAPANEPVQFVTGNSYVPAVRSFPEAERIWQAGSPEDWERFLCALDSLLNSANVLLDEPDWDNALYVVDLNRFEYDDEGDGESLQGDWKLSHP